MTPPSEAERRAQRTLAAADKLLNRNPPAQTAAPGSAEAELMRYMEELRSKQTGHASAVLRPPGKPI
ncbi:hypothetical protein [Bordetella pseudohinzii]|uniref:hypothetical protein n=1 Tax=Bordetella pseudohinzii TaxID=1331258 RepID=UPI00045B07AB|nr:hypothetical protein [Bordetella pseudohinzii]